MDIPHNMGREKLLIWLKKFVFSSDFSSALGAISAALFSGFSADFPRVFLGLASADG